MSTVAAAKVTPEEFLAMPDRGRFELVDGELVEVNVSVLSSLVGLNAAAELRGHCKAHNLGLVWGADNLIRCFADPNKFRKPDACFVRIERIPADWEEDAAIEIAPDLIVEVVSPNDTAYDLRIKIREYLDAGVPLVWVFYPPTKTVSIYRTDGTASELGIGDDLDGEDVIPGFRCPVSDLFPASPVRRA